ncbi:MAG: ribosomal-protein-alanine N-acetyltransferase [Candidatus Firestonebacteria bacterium RIFOXYC2_FULL_39_67]|nr:MAG: ribosomal-protein-alanine N-acetyltransferase [Candidatus Firestonebacteria bacterium RIFOXYD2_FULL_39_29]OGF54540.1 MAG: ribosomal-protein-alanine N-acetyltransferase [Candidatus Firestonebacteria bacterium RIFOXYC2_FULL_39_67]OGF57933.1 MAG: ribosomal-protein-alanine N-acetyltransferase [Candidatus Firestonebacteria bacterium RifOxyC12_full_39_7]
MLEIAKMLESDVDSVAALEANVFTLPWSRALILKDIKENNSARFFTAREDNLLVGYGGFWLLQDEMNIVNIAVHPEHRKKGLGKQLLKHLLTEGLKEGAKFATLDVRVNNTAAKKLYESAGFILIAVRKKYYTDNQEDALVMWLNPIKL